MVATIGKIPGAGNQSMPYTSAWELSTADDQGKEVANDEEPKSAHEEGYRRQRIDMISDIPGGVCGLAFWDAGSVVKTNAGHSPKMPPLHIVFALLLGKAIAGELAATSQSDGRSQPASHDLIEEGSLEELGCRRYVLVLKRSSRPRAGVINIHSTQDT